jgi:hypothetical protein
LGREVFSACSAGADAACVGWAGAGQRWTDNETGAYLGAGEAPAARRDAAAWVIGGDLLLFGGSLPSPPAPDGLRPGRFDPAALELAPFDRSRTIDGTGAPSDSWQTALEATVFDDELLCFRPERDGWESEKNRAQEGGGPATPTAAPTARAGAVAWSDGNGGAFLFGGYASTALGTNDLWMLAPAAGPGDLVWRRLAGTHDPPQTPRVGGSLSAIDPPLLPFSPTPFSLPMTPFSFSDDAENASPENAAPATGPPGTFSHESGTIVYWLADLDRRAEQRYPPARAFATATVMPGVPRVTGRDGARDCSHVPGFVAAARVGWAGYMFGGVTDLGYQHMVSHNPGLGSDTPRPRFFSDVWRFETTGGGACGLGYTSSASGGLAPGVNITWTYMPAFAQRAGPACDYACRHLDTAATLYSDLDQDLLDLGLPVTFRHAGGLPVTFSNEKVDFQIEDGAALIDLIETQHEESDEPEAKDFFAQITTAESGAGRGGMRGGSENDWPAARYRHAAWGMRGPASAMRAWAAGSREAPDTSHLVDHRLYIFGGIGGAPAPPTPHPPARAQPPCPPAALSVQRVAAVGPDKFIVELSDLWQMSRFAAGFAEGLLSSCLPILVYRENPYRCNTWG